MFRVSPISETTSDLERLQIKAGRLQPRGRAGSPYGDVAVFALDCLPDGKHGHFADLALTRASGACTRR